MRSLGEQHRNNLFIYKDEYRSDPSSMHKDAKGYDPQKFLVESKDKYFFNNEIRWSNIGYHYDWDHRCYCQNLNSVIPSEFVELSR